MGKAVSNDELLGRISAGNCVIEAGEVVKVRGFDLKVLENCDIRDGSVVEFAAGLPRLGTDSTLATQVHPEETPVSDAAHPVEAPAEEAIHLPVAAPPTQAQVAAAPDLPADLKSVIPADANGITVVMALIAVAGGGAAWKFYENFSKRKHEENMARIENESKRQDDSHGKCEAARQQMMADFTARMTALESKLQGSLDDVKVSGGSSESLEDIEERLAKVEKQLKKPAKK